MQNNVSGQGLQYMRDIFLIIYRLRTNNTGGWVRSIHGATLTVLKGQTGGDGRRETGDGEGGCASWHWLILLQPECQPRNMATVPGSGHFDFESGWHASFWRFKKKKRKKWSSPPSSHLPTWWKYNETNALVYLATYELTGVLHDARLFAAFAAFFCSCASSVKCFKCSRTCQASVNLMFERWNYANAKLRSCKFPQDNTRDVKVTTHGAKQKKCSFNIRTFAWDFKSEFSQNRELNRAWRGFAEAAVCSVWSEPDNIPR